LTATELRTTRAPAAQCAFHKSVSIATKANRYHDRFALTRIAADIKTSRDLFRNAFVLLVDRRW